MANHTSKDNENSDLRLRAEKRIVNDKAGPCPQPVMPEDDNRIIHDLHIHQVELTLQNEELRRTQEKLEVSRAKYFQLYDLAPVGYFTLSEKGMITEANLTATTLLGVPRSALIKMPFSRFILPEDQDIYYHHRQQLFNSGDPQVCELRLLRSKTDQFWVRLDATLGEDCKGETVCRAVMSDITQRKKAEASLWKTNEKLLMAQDAARAGSWEWNILTGKNIWSEELWRLYGLQPDSCEASYEVWKQTIVPEDRKKTERIVLDAVNKGVEINVEWRVRDPDGRERWLMSRGKPFTDDAGNVERYMGIVIDITDRIRMEEERKHLQAELFQNHKMESVGRLAGGVAHDFNNMLMVILGNTELALAETDSSASLHPYLEAIYDSALRSANLTRQLLAFARKQAICPRIIDLNVMIAGMNIMLQRLIGENIELIFKPGDNLWPVHMDPSQIDQILINLVVNARDAISGVGRLTIETLNRTCAETSGLPHDEVLPGDYVLMEIRDTGKGMDEETISHLFEPFYTTKTQGKGTGLGLATVYGIVKQNNGFITVSSQANQGTSFYIYLPRTQVPRKKEHPLPLETPARGNETVLLVEDELSILKLGTMILKKYGYTVLDARSPKEALSFAETYPQPIHLLITDVIMPQMNGRDLYEKISALRPEIKTLFMSGYTDDIIADHGVLDEGIHFLQKPFSTKTLAATVREILDNTEASKTPAP